MLTRTARLVETCRSLPGERAALPSLALSHLGGLGDRLPASPLLSRQPGPAHGDTTLDGIADATSDAIADVRRRVGAFLDELATRVEPALCAALERATRAWDQVDALVLRDAALQQEEDALRAAVESLPSAPRLEARLTLDAAVGLVRLVEQRLATLARLRLRAGGELLPGGRPFLDVAGALTEAARAWSAPTGAERR